MVSIRMTMAAALVAAACPSASWAQAPGGVDPVLGSSAADVARIRAMDVAGVRLGATPEQARAALRSSSYAPTPDDSRSDRRPKVERNYDYATRMDRTRRERLNDFSPSKATETIVAEEWSRGDERVRVVYVPMRDGVRVSGVLYTIPGGRIGWEAIRSSAVAKYGRPTRLSDDLHKARWCGDGACAAVGADFAEMSLTDGWRLELADGGAFDRLSREQAAADADASTRRTGRPSF